MADFRELDVDDIEKITERFCEKLNLLISTTKFVMKIRGENRLTMEALDEIDALMEGRTSIRNVIDNNRDLTILPNVPAKFAPLPPAYRWGGYFQRDLRGISRENWGSLEPQNCFIPLFIIGGCNYSERTSGRHKNETNILREVVVCYITEKHACLAARRSISCIISIQNYPASQKNLDFLNLGKSTTPDLRFKEAILNAQPNYTTNISRRSDNDIFASRMEPIVLV